MTGRIEKMNKEDIIKICRIIKDMVIEKIYNDEELKINIDDESLNISIMYDEPEHYGCYHAGYRKEYEHLYIYFDEILKRFENEGI